MTSETYTAEQMKADLAHQLRKLRDAPSANLSDEIQRSKAMCEVSSQIIDLAKEQTKFMVDWGGQHTLFQTGQELAKPQRMLKGI